MPWTRIPGIEGLFYEPETPPPNRSKHACEECYSCLMCSDYRCGVCRNNGSENQNSDANTCGCKHVTESGKKT